MTNPDSTKNTSTASRPIEFNCQNNPPVWSCHEACDINTAMAANRRARSRKADTSRPIRLITVCTGRTYTISRRSIKLSLLSQMLGNDP